jgi:hypothetical protein
MLNAIGETINRAIIAKWIEKGHHLSGVFESKLRYEITEGNPILIEGFGQHYAKYMERGVKAANVPFTPPSGRGGKSAYIEGLARYAEARMGLSGKEALGAAFAIAHKHKRLGIRIRERGQGSKFLSEALKDPSIDRVIDKEMDLYLGKKVDGVFNKYFK